MKDTTLSQPAVNQMLLTDFLASCGTGLMERLESTAPPKFNNDNVLQHRQSLLDAQSRKPFEAQSRAIHAVSTQLVDFMEPAAVINGEMGTGKTLMGISVANVLHHEGFPRCLVICPPHLVYKWRREVLATIPKAKVWVLNGPDTLMKLIQLREVRMKPTEPEFFIMGRVRMRMGFDWEPSFVSRRVIEEYETPLSEQRFTQVSVRYAACPDCGEILPGEDSETPRLLYITAREHLSKRRCRCNACGASLWQLVSKRASRPRSDVVRESLMSLPTIGQKRADGLIDTFGVELLSNAMQDNTYELVNLQDESGDFVFSDNAARRIERYLANAEFSFGSGGYQPTEFIKRYLPQNFFGLLLADEGHEYKNEGSAQGQAMGVLARKCAKTVLLTGTLMGGYADDLFYLLWRVHPKMMMNDGFSYNEKNSLSAASMNYMRQYGVLKDVYTSYFEDSHKTARGKKSNHRVSKAPGFSPVGVMRHILPMTVFVRLSDLGENVLPAYVEEVIELPMSDVQRSHYDGLTSTLRSELRIALSKGDRTLMGVVLNALLSWPDCCFNEMEFKHPRTRITLASTPVIFEDDEWSPKELELLNICKSRKARGRKVLVYSTYTQTRDTTGRLKKMLEVNGFKVAILRSSVDASKREDWLLDQVDRGVEVIITNPELVKTGLDMLEFPTIVFMQTGFNVYTVQQAARRSWRIGQTQAVEVIYLGYEKSSQTACLQLMASKIAVSQSTSGDMPDTGLDILNQSDDNIETALAKQLLTDPAKLESSQKDRKRVKAVQESFGFEQLIQLDLSPTVRKFDANDHDSHDIHKLLTERFKSKAKYDFNHKVDKDEVFWAKLFDFAGTGTWYVSDYDPISKIGFGFVTGLAFDEWGSFSIDEMQSIFKLGKPCIEFDVFFEPILVDQIMPKLCA